MVMKVLSVAEKPSVARELAKILSNGTASSRRGEAQYNMLYDFSCTLDGRPCQMIHRPELAKARPIDVPILISAFGPKGQAIAREVADGWMGMSPPPYETDWSVHMVNGTVLAPGESPSAPRVLAYLCGVCWQPRGLSECHERC